MPVSAWREEERCLKKKKDLSASLELISDPTKHDPQHRRKPVSGAGCPPGDSRTAVEYGSGKGKRIGDKSATLRTSRPNVVAHACNLSTLGGQGS